MALIGYICPICRRKSVQKNGEWPSCSRCGKRMVKVVDDKPVGILKRIKRRILCFFIRILPEGD
jgi:hypothetical protein